MARKPKNQEAEASEPAEVEAADAEAPLAEEIRRFKSPRNKMSAHDVVRLAERLEVKDARALPYEKLRVAIRAALRARHGHG